MAYRKSKPWLIKPPPGTGIDWSDALAKSLVAWWPFNEGAGGNAADITGRINTANLSASGAQWGPGRYGASLLTTSSTQQASAPLIRVSPWGGTTSASWAFRIKVNAPTQGARIWTQWSTVSVGTSQGCFLFATSGTNQLTFALRNNAEFYVTNTTASFTVGIWYDVVATWSAANGTNIYFNGVLQAQSPSGSVSGLPISILPVEFGKEAVENAGGTLMNLEDARIWTRELRQNEAISYTSEPFRPYIKPIFNLISPSASGVTGSGAPTEGADVAAGSGKITIIAVGAATEGADIAAGVGKETIIGTAAVTEGADIAAGVGTEIITGSGSVTEGADVAAGIGKETITGAGAATEGADVAAGSGSVIITSLGAVIEGADFAAGIGAFAQTGHGAATEGADTAAGVGHFAAFTTPTPTGRVFKAPLQPRSFNAKDNRTFKVIRD